MGGDRSMSDKSHSRVSNRSPQRATAVYLVFCFKFQNESVNIRKSIITSVLVIIIFIFIIIDTKTNIIKSASEIPAANPLYHGHTAVYIEPFGSSIVLSPLHRSLGPKHLLRTVRLRQSLPYWAFLPFRLRAFRPFHPFQAFRPEHPGHRRTRQR